MFKLLIFMLLQNGQVNFKNDFMIFLVFCMGQYIFKEHGDLYLVIQMCS